MNRCKVSGWQIMRSPHEDSVCLMSILIPNSAGALIRCSGDSEHCSRRNHQPKSTVMHLHCILFLFYVVVVDGGGDVALIKRDKNTVLEFSWTKITHYQRDRTDGRDQSLPARKTTTTTTDIGPANSTRSAQSSFLNAISRFLYLSVSNWFDQFIPDGFKLAIS